MWIESTVQRFFISLFILPIHHSFDIPFDFAELLKVSVAFLAIKINLDLEQCVINS